MPVDRELRRSTFAKLQRHLSKLSAEPRPENVHRFRTYSRRVESILFELVPKLDSNQKKLLKMLKRLRNKAGRVRDLDIEIAALRGLKISQAPAGKAHFLRVLADERAKRLRKLGKCLDKRTAAELRSRIGRAEKETVIPENVDPIVAGLRLFNQLGDEDAPLSEKKLHQYRIVGKRARYLAETAGDDPEAKTVVERLKRLQDAIGDWHDWLELTSKAEQLLDQDHNSALLVALRNLTRAKFRQAVHALAETQKSLKKVAETISSRKRPVVIAEAAAA